MKDIRICKVTKDRVNFTTALNSQVIALTYVDVENETKSIVLKNCYDIIRFFRDLEVKMDRVDKNPVLADKASQWADTFEAGISIDGVTLNMDELILYNADSGLVFGPKDFKAVLATIIIDFIM